MCRRFDPAPVHFLIRLVECLAWPVKARSFHPPLEGRAFCFGWRPDDRFSSGTISFMAPVTDMTGPVYSVVVVGAGAAGLLAAARSAERGHRTLLVEKNRKPGVKILMSGGTRCNLTHDCDVAGIIGAFGSAGSFLHSPLAALGPRELVGLFHEEGLATKVEPGGKIFPESDRALDVRDALLRRLERCGGELALDEAVTSIEREGASFVVSTSMRILKCDKLIITTGGKSYPGCGTTGDGYAWLAAMGHTIRPPRPALVPLVSDDAWLHELSGLTIPDVLVRVIDPAMEMKPGGRRRPGRLPHGVLIERRGSLLFTHFGLSGPAAMDVSRAVTGAKGPRDVKLIVDFLPAVSAAELEKLLRESIATDGRRQVVNLLGDVLPKRLLAALQALAGVPSDRRGAELSNVERGRLFDCLKKSEIGVTGTRGFDKAEVTAGGVVLDEVDSRNMQSKLVPNLYLAGEILDLDGFIGGYNFQAAFSTGYLAGDSV
jgi:predicted Rossmann fold flavoprotein